MNVVEVLVDPEWPRGVRLGLLREAAGLAQQLDCSFRPPKDATGNAVMEVVLRLRGCVAAAGKLGDAIRQNLIDVDRWPPMPEGEPPIDMILPLPERRGEDVHARITDWAIVELTEPCRPSTKHVVGYVGTHARIVAHHGEPYVGSQLKKLDVAKRMARNQRGKLILLVGEPLPPGPLPRDIRAVLQRVERQWALHSDAEWKRIL